MSVTETVKRVAPQRNWRALWYSAWITSLLPWAMLHWAGTSYIAYHHDTKLVLQWLQQGQWLGQVLPPAEGQFVLSLGPQQTQTGLSATTRRAADAADAALQASFIKSHDAGPGPTYHLAWQSGHIELALFPLQDQVALKTLEQLRQGQQAWAMRLDLWHFSCLLLLMLALGLWLQLWRVSRRHHR